MRGRDRRMCDYSYYSNILFSFYVSNPICCTDSDIKINPAYNSKSR
jgi:hypothetical protein